MCPLMWRTAWTHTHLPLEVRCDGEFHLEKCTCEGLHMGCQLQARELVDQAVQRLPVLGHADELTQLLQRQWQCRVYLKQSQSQLVGSYLPTAGTGQRLEHEHGAHSVQSDQGNHSTSRACSSFPCLLPLLLFCL